MAAVAGMSQRIRVLVVDDDPLVRAALAVMLASADDIALAGEAADGEQAEQTATENVCDVVLMDIRMPGRDGVTILQEMGPPPPRVIMMTAYAVEEQMRRALDADAFAVVQKPFQVGYLLNLVEGAAEEAS